MTFEGENKILRLLFTHGKLDKMQIERETKIKIVSLNYSIRNLLEGEAIKKQVVKGIEIYQITQIGKDRLDMLRENDKLMQNRWARRVSKC